MKDVKTALEEMGVSSNEVSANEAKEEVFYINSTQQLSLNHTKKAREEMGGNCNEASTNEVKTEVCYGSWTV